MPGLLDKKAFTEKYNAHALHVLQVMSMQLEAERKYRIGQPRYLGDNEWGFIVFGRKPHSKEPSRLSIVLEFSDEPDLDDYRAVIHFISNGNAVASYELIESIGATFDKIQSIRFINEISERIENVLSPLQYGVLDWMPEEEIDSDVMPDRAPASFSQDVVKESLFDLEVEFTVPKWFWSEEGTAPWQDPEEQAHLWEEGRPKRGAENREQWLERFHHALINHGWPRENIDALYSYFEGEVENPDEGEEKEDPDVSDVMRFRVSIPGDWLVDHPVFLDNLEWREPGIPIWGEHEGSRLSYYRISALRGPLNGMTLESTGFVVRQPFLEA